MKSSNIWHCEDCHTIGFYYGMTDEEILEKHRKDCVPKEPTESVVRDRTYYPEFFHIARHRPFRE